MSAVSDLEVHHSQAPNQMEQVVKPHAGLQRQLPASQKLERRQAQTPLGSMTSLQFPNYLDSVHEIVLGRPLTSWKRRW